VEGPSRPGLRIMLAGTAVGCRSTAAIETAAVGPNLQLQLPHMGPYIHRGTVEDVGVRDNSALRISPHTPSVAWLLTMADEGPA
jgi:hypothetical protein